MKFKKWLISYVLCFCTLGTLVAYAAAQAEPTDYYDTIYEQSTLEVGEDIPSGEYCLFNSKDTGNASYSIKNGSKVLVSDSFKYNAIVYLENDDTLYLTNCYAVDYSEARIQPVEECMIKVGDDGQVKPGKYCIKFVRSSSTNATATVYSTIDFHNYDEDDEDSEDTEKVYTVSNGGIRKLELKEGEYINLSGCKLMGLDEDDKD